MSEKVVELISIIKFGIIGISNTLINWIIFFLLNLVEVNYILANIIAYSLATINSYIWNSKWVFKYNNEKLVSSLKFIIVNLVGLILNTIILFILVDMFNINKIISLVMATGVVMILNYISNRLWVFKQKTTINNWIWEWKSNTKVIVEIIVLVE